MNRKSRFAIILSSLALASTLLQSAFAQLPSLNDPPWLGYFAAHGGNRYNFAVTAMGEMVLIPVGTKGPVNNKLGIEIQALILETVSGNPSPKRLIPDTLETTDTPTDKFEKSVYRCKVSGGATIEVTMEQSRGMIFIGGRVLDPGTIKNPASIALSVKIPNLYPHEKAPAKDDDEKSSKAEEREASKKEKDFLKKIEKDSLTLKWADDKRKKFDLSETLDAITKEGTLTNVVELKLESAAYQGREAQITASPNSTLTIVAGSNPAPLYKGFTLQWTPDTAKDPDGKARLALVVR